jgi:hypothetical protein
MIEFLGKFHDVLLFSPVGENPVNFAFWNGTAHLFRAALSSGRPFVIRRCNEDRQGDFEGGETIVCTTLAASELESLTRQNENPDVRPCARFDHSGDDELPDFRVLQVRHDNVKRR